MPRLAIDWQAIKARLPSVDAPFLVAIPDGGRLALIGMCEMLLWRASYLDGHSYTDDEFDEIRDTIEALTLGLLEGMNMDELFGYIDGLEGQVQQLIDMACCPTPGGTTIAEAETKNTFASGGSIGAVGEVEQLPPAVTVSPVGGLDATGIIDLDSDGTIGQTEWDSYLCRLAAWMFDLLLDMMRLQKTGFGQLLTAIDLAAWYGFRLARRVIAGPADDVVLFSLEHLYDMASAMTAEITDTQTDAAIAEMEAAREATICAMAAATTSEEMASALLSNISASITLSAWVTLASAGPWLTLSRIIWGSRVDAPDYDCSGCAPAPPPIVGVGYYPISITGVVFNDTANVTFSNKAWDANGFSCDAAAAIGTYPTVDVTIAPSAYAGDANVAHRGIIYYDGHHTHPGNSGLEMSNLGNGNIDHNPAQYECLYASPYPNYFTDMQAATPFTLVSRSTTAGLNFTVDVARTIRIKVLFGGGGSGHINLSQMYWMLDEV